MHRLPDILRSPPNQTSKRESITFAQDRNQDEQRARKIRTSYVARKISNDDIHDASMRQSSAMMLLSQIKEEKNIEELSEEQSQVELNFDDNKNVFQTSNFVSSKFKEPSKGPSYYNGQIIRHSIVGSVDFYEKAHQTHEKAQRIKALGSYDPDSANNSTADRKFLRAPSSMNSLDENSNSRSGTATSFAMKKTLMKGKSKEAREIKMTKDELTRKFIQLKENEHNFYHTEAKKYSNLNYAEKLNHTREERCLKKFDEVNEIWDKNVAKLTQKIGKEYESSVMMRSGGFREKVEIANILEANKTIHERFGSRLWPATLRREISLTNKRNNSIAEAVPLGFSMLDPIEPKTPIEVIRTPLRMTMTSLSGSKDFSSSAKLLNRTGDEYLNTKISKLGKLLSSIKPANVVQTSSMMIEGKNKLDSEINAFLRKNQDKDIIHLPKTFLQPQNTRDIEEIFEEQYDKTDTIKNVFSL